VMLTNKSNKRKNDGRAKLFTARAPSYGGRGASVSANSKLQGSIRGSRVLPPANSIAAGVISPMGVCRGTPSPAFNAPYNVSALCEQANRRQPAGTAKTLSLTQPQTLLVAANELIE
jgi:hypothetical protein